MTQKSTIISLRWPKSVTHTVHMYRKFILIWDTPCRMCQNNCHTKFLFEKSEEKRRNALLPDPESSWRKSFNRSDTTLKRKVFSGKKTNKICQRKVSLKEKHSNNNNNNNNTLWKFATSTTTTELIFVSRDKNTIVISLRSEKLWRRQSAAPLIG